MNILRVWDTLRTWLRPVSSAENVAPADSVVPSPLPELDEWMMMDTGHHHLIKFQRYAGKNPIRLSCSLSVHVRVGESVLVTQADGKGATCSEAFSSALAALSKTVTSGEVEHGPNEKDQ